MSNQLTLEEIELLKELVEYNRKQVELYGGDQNFVDGLVVLNLDDFSIYDVFVDETMIHQVDPVEYYGLYNIKEMINEWIKIK